MGDSQKIVKICITYTTKKESVLGWASSMLLLAAYNHTVNFYRADDNTSFCFQKFILSAFI